GGGDRVRAAVARGTVDARVPDRVLVELAGLLEVKAGSGVARVAARQVDPRATGGVTDGEHVAVAVNAGHARGRVNIPLGLGAHAGVAGVALVGEVCQAHAGRVGR